VKRVTLTIFIVSSLIILVLLRYYLFFITESFTSNFARQNASEIAAGDIYALTKRLSGISSTLPLTCIRASKNGTVFFKIVEGRCGSDLIHSTTKINQLNNGGIIIEATFKLPKELVFTGIFSLLSQMTLAGILIFVTRRHERRVAQGELEIARLQGELNEAIVATTQALAHDVRKPFSLLKMGLKTLSSGDDPEEIRDLAGALSQEVNLAMNSVNSMLADILQAGANQPPQKEKVDLARLLDGIFKSLSTIHPQTYIKYNTEILHGADLMVQEMQFTRVLQNIIDNAAQAMEFKGEISVYSQDKRVGERNFISIVIRNTGSYIPPAELAEVFKPFFTKGKKEGTGLGLAIVRKIVLAHGGDIICRSDKILGTEFEISLPA